MASTKSVLERMIAAMNRGGDAAKKAVLNPSCFRQVKRDFFW